MWISRKLSCEKKQPLEPESGWVKFCYEKEGKERLAKMLYICKGQWHMQWASSGCASVDFSGSQIIDIQPIVDI